MSGSSLNYLCHKSGVEALGESWAIERAIAELVDFGGSRQLNVSTALTQLNRMLAIGQEADDIMRDVSSLLHDIEWYISGDYGADTLTESIREYAAVPHPTPPETREAGLVAYDAGLVRGALMLLESVAHKAGANSGVSIAQLAQGALTRLEQQLGTPGKDVTP